MINILANRYMIDSDWCYDQLKQYIQADFKVAVIPFSFRDSQINSSGTWATYYKPKTGIYYEGVIASFKRYGIQENQIQWINYFEHSSDEAKHIVKEADLLYLTGGLPDKMMERLQTFDLIEHIQNHQGIVMGFSAGACVQLETYHLTPDLDYPEFRYFKGMGLIDHFSIEVHYSGAENQLKSIDRVLKETGKPVYAIEDEGAVIITGDRVIQIGKVHYFEPTQESIMNKSKMNDTEYVLNQYKDGKNLKTRLSLYEKYSTNTVNYATWIHQNYSFFEGCQILEFGAGTGKDWKDKISTLPASSTLILSDFSEGMVEALTSDFGSHKQVEVMALDIQNTDFDDHSKDFIIANSMLYHVPDIHQSIAEVSRLLKSDGTFYAATAGNKNMFQYFNETYLKINSKIKLPKTISFTLENGAQYLEPHFKHIEIARYINRLEVTDPKDIVDFIYSVSSVEGLEETDRQEMLDFYEQEMKREGIIKIDIEYGLFIAKK